MKTPSLNLRPGFSIFESTTDSFPQVWIDPDLLGEEHWLRQAWEQVLKPSLDTCADELAVIVTRTIVSMGQRLALFERSAEKQSAWVANQQPTGSTAPRPPIRLKKAKPPGKA